MKRTLSLVLALVMILGTFTTVFAATEAETTAAEFLAKEGILQGADGDLMLDKNLERRDAVVLLSRLLGVEEEAAEFLTTEDSPSWEDARTDAYYVPFFAWAEENGYFEGDDEGNFNPRNAITAQEYALVLLRALGYDVKGNEAWKAALETAEKAGLLKDVEVENKDEVVRGQMAVMTFNALGAKINGTDETLAEKLGIEMPEAPKATDLEVKVYSENLKEVIVELNNAELVDQEDLLDTENYKMIDNSVIRVTLDGDNVIVELTNPMTRNTSYELIIGGINKALNKRHSFKAYDNAAPVVEKVEVLGEYGIKVTTTEPIVDNARERFFAVDGKNIAMEMEQYGRELILTPYYSAEFPADAKELTIVGLEDYAGFRSSKDTFDIEINKDDVAPTVTGIELVDDYTIEVTFDKDIYKNSVKPYDSKKQVGNVSYGQGRHIVYSRPEARGQEEYFATKVETNKARYVFEERLPRNVDITVEGVQNHSKVTMEAVTERAVVNLDRRQPTVLETSFAKLSDSKVRFTIYFDKTVSLDSRIKNADNSIDQAIAKQYIEVYNGSVVRNRIESNARITRFEHSDRDARNTVIVEIDGLSLNVKPDYGFDYILEVKNISSTSNFTVDNVMHVYYEDFELLVDADKFRVLGVDYVAPNFNNQGFVELEIQFSNPVNRAVAEDKTNYYFINRRGGIQDIAQLKGEVTVHRDGERVILSIPTKAYNGMSTTGTTDGPAELYILETIRDKDGARLPRSVWNFDLRELVGNIEDEKADLRSLMARALAARPTFATNPQYIAAETVLNDKAAKTAHVEAAIKDLEAAIEAEAGLVQEMVKKELEKVLDADKKEKLGKAFEKLAVEGFDSVQDFLNKVANDILAELKGVDVLAKASIDGRTATATINGVTVEVKAKLNEKVLSYTIKVGSADAVEAVLSNNIVVKVDAYTLKFTSNAKDVTVVVYQDEVKMSPSATSALTYNLPVGTYEYHVLAEGYTTVVRTIDLKKNEEINVHLLKK